MSTNNGQPGGVPALGDDGSGGGPPAGGGRTGAIVVAVILGLLAVLAIYVFGGDRNQGMVDTQPEEFRLRAAGRLPQDPGPAQANNMGESDLDAERRRREEAEREERRRAEQALIDAQRAAMAQQFDSREKQAEETERKRAAEQAERRRQQEYQKRLRAGVSIASTASNTGASAAAPGADAAAASGPALNAADPFARDRAADSAAVAAAAGQEGAADPFAFLPAARSSRFDRTAAVYGGPLDMRIAPGRLIRGVLETAISTDQPGGIRAIVSEDVYSEDGQRILIPKMSRLWGEYRATAVAGQKRVGVIWSRLVRPDGVDVALRGIGTDPLGMSGLEGDVDNKFWTRFGGAILQSMLEVAEERASDDQDLEIVTGDTQTAASVALQNAQNVQPTIYVDQGTSINVLVANDLDFRDVTLMGLNQ